MSDLETKNRQLHRLIIESRNERTGAIDYDDQSAMAYEILVWHTAQLADQKQRFVEAVPKKYHPVQYREFLVADKKMPIEENQRQAKSYLKGFNAAVDEILAQLNKEGS